MEGNQMKMREALMQVSLSCSACPRHNCKGCTRPFASFMPAVRKALSAPPRNCDMVKTGEEAKYWFLQIAELPEGNGDADMREWYRKLIAWLFAPATERKGEVA